MMNTLMKQVLMLMVFVLALAHGVQAEPTKLDIGEFQRVPVVPDEKKMNSKELKARKAYEAKKIAEVMRKVQEREAAKERAKKKRMAQAAEAQQNIEGNKQQSNKQEKSQDLIKQENIKNPKATQASN